MIKETSLIKSTIIFGVGDLGSKFIGFLLLPFYSIYLSPAQYGVWDLLNTTQLLIVPLLSMQIFDSVYRYLLEDSKKAKSYFSNAVFFNLVIWFSGLIATLIVLALLREDNLYYLILFVLSILTIMNSLLLQTARALGRLNFYASASIGNAFFTSICSYFLIKYYQADYQSLAIGLSLGLIVSILVLLVGTRKMIGFSIADLNFGIIKSLILFSLPIVPNTISWWVINLSDRFLIKHFIGEEQLGIFGMAFKLASIIFIINAIFNKAWQTNFISRYDMGKGSEYFCVVFQRFFKVQFIFATLLTLAFPYIFSIVFDDTYDGIIILVPLIATSLLFNSFSIFYGNIYWATKRMNKIFLPTAIIGLINISINVLLIPLIGLYGAIISTLTSYLLLWIYRIYDTNRVMKTDINFKLFMGYLLVLIISIICLWIFNPLQLLILAFLIGIIFLFFNKSELQFLINLTKK